MVSTQITCSVIAVVAAIISILIYVFAIQPNMKSGYHSGRQMLMLGDDRYDRRGRGRYNRRNNYTSTSMIKSMMVNRMPRGLSTNDNRSRYKETMCCGGM
jgi:hypothetical protein